MPLLHLFLQPVRDLLRRETESMTLVEREAVLRGPLWTYHRVARHELGGPVLQQVMDLPGFPRALLASPVGFRLFVIAAPGLIVFGLLAAINSALRASWAGWAWIAAVGLMLISVTASALTFSLAIAKTRAILSRHFARWSYEDMFWWCVLAIVMPAVGFAAVGSLLIAHEWIGFKGVQSTDPDLGFRTFEVFVWNLADAVPVLKIPTTLNWVPSVKFNTVPGEALVLAYKIMLVLPFLQLLAIGLARTFGAASGGGDADPERRRDAGGA